MSIWQKGLDRDRKRLEAEHSLAINDLQRRVEEYFQSGQRREPAGRLILDLMRALRKALKNGD